MGRAEQGKVREQGNQLLSTENANAQTNAGNAATTFGQAEGGYSSLYNNPGYDAATKSAITNATEGGIGAAYGTAGQQVANQTARTRNSAGENATLDDLARQRMQTSAAAASGNQITEANAAREDKLRALQGIQGLYGTSTGAGLGYTGQSNATLSTLNSSANQKNAFNESLESALGKSLGTFNFGMPSNG